jgi:hypothetical protein
MKEEKVTGNKVTLDISSYRRIVFGENGKCGGGKFCEGVMILWSAGRRPWRIFPVVGVR